MSISFKKSELMEVLAMMENEAVYRIISSETEAGKIAWKHDQFGAYALCLQMGWIDNAELIELEDEFVQRVCEAEEVANNG